MSFLFVRYPQFRRSCVGCSKKAGKAAAVISAVIFAVVFLASCSSELPKGDGANSESLALQDIPGKPVGQTGQVPAAAEVEKEDLNYRSNRWAEVKPEMQAYLNINKPGEEAGAKPLVPGPGDSPAAAGGKTASSSKSAAAGPNAEVQAKGDVVEKLKKDLAEIDSTADTAHKSPVRRLAEEKKDSPSGQTTGSDEETDTLLVNNSSSGAADDRRAMFSTGSNPDGSSAAVSNSAEPENAAGKNSLGRPADPAGGAARTSGFAPFFVILAAALFGILGLKTFRRSQRK